jgi:hypothetical protein
MTTKAPDLRLVCLTYDTNGVVEGDEVILTGNLIPRGPDHIQLDPCLHHRAGYGSAGLVGVAFQKSVWPAYPVRRRDSLACLCCQRPG